MFKEYREYLDFEYSINFWSDQGIDAAISLLNSFNDDDWMELGSSWNRESEGWKIRCAETLDGVKSISSVKILSEMLSDRSLKVVVAAADSLRSWSGESLSYADIDVEMLTGLANKLTGIDRVVVDDLLTRL